MDQEILIEQQQEEIMLLKNDLIKAREIIRRELGIEDINLDEILKQDGNLIGRSKQIESLQIEIRELYEQIGTHVRAPLVRRFSELTRSSNSLHEELQLLQSSRCKIEKVNHLSNFTDEFPEVISPLLGNGQFRSVYGGEGFLPLDAFIYRGTYVLAKAVFGPNQELSSAKQWLRGGPRKHLFFDPSKVRVAIVTCGGLCPGLNVVIRELVNTLHFNYQVESIQGIKYGYKGFYSYDWITLTPQMVRNIHREGGTILGSSRGGFKLKEIVDSIEAKNINQIYCLGGDGTHKGILELSQEFARRKLHIAIVGIPKTIDNDIPIIDKSFGFETAVQEAQSAIQSAKVEANCAEFGVGLVRLMGRNSGFIAMEAVNASRDVHVCLIPEFKFNLYGDYGLLEHCYQRLLKRNRLVMVAAEGAGEAMLDRSVKTESTDLSGNVKSEDVGSIIKTELTKYCLDKKMVITLKYIDPTYMIRTTEANAADKNLCAQLAQNSVHGLMAGFTGFTVGHVNNKIAYIPIEELISGKYANRVMPDSRNWQRLLASTGQPSFLNDESAMCQLSQ